MMTAFQQSRPSPQIRPPVAQPYISPTGAIHNNNNNISSLGSHSLNTFTHQGLNPINNNNNQTQVNDTGAFAINRPFSSTQTNRLNGIQQNGQSVAPILETDEIYIVRNYVNTRDQSAYLRDLAEPDIPPYMTFRSGYTEVESREHPCNRMNGSIPSQLKYNPRISLYEEDLVVLTTTPSELATMDSPDRWVKKTNELEIIDEKRKTWHRFLFNNPGKPIGYFARYIDQNTGFLKLENNPDAQLMVASEWSWNNTLSKLGKFWSCKYPGRIRDVDTVPPQMSSLFFHLPSDDLYGVYWPVDHFLSYLQANNYAIRIKFMPHQLKETFRYQNNNNNQVNPELLKICDKGVIVSQIVIETMNSQLLDLFDMQLYSANFNQNHPVQQYQDLRHVPWFNPLGGNLCHSVGAPPKGLILNQIVTPGELRGPKSVYYPDTKVIDSPEFQRWIYADIDALKRELAGYRARADPGIAPYYFIPGISSTTVHPKTLGQFIAISQFYPRIRSRSAVLNASRGGGDNNNALEHIASIYESSKGDVPSLMISTQIIDEIVNEKNTGCMDKNLWVMRYDQPIILELRVKDMADTSKIAARMARYAKDNDIKTVHFSMQLTLTTEPYLGNFPEQPEIVVGS